MGRRRFVSVARIAKLGARRALAVEVQRVALAVKSSIRAACRELDIVCMRSEGAREGCRTSLRLSGEEREEISRGIWRRESLRTIAARLHRSPSTISREVAAMGGRSHYGAWSANEMALERARRPRPRKLEANPRLRRIVEQRLDDYWSPQQIAAHLKSRYPDDPSMHISHETIYQSLFVQGRGALRKELSNCLRRGRGYRRPKSRVSSGAGVMRNMVMISDRPAEIEDRAVPGHWEGDLIIGKGGQSAIGTLVERQSRYVMLFRLPRGRTAEQVRAALVSQVRTLPTQLRRSLTWDQGHEMAEHTRFTIQTGVKVYFCDPHSPWQRGSNENTNGLLRQFFPKHSDLSVYTQGQLNAVSHKLNSRPRQTLDWLTPSTVLSRAVATAA